MKTEYQVREEMRNTEAGRLLVRYGFEPYETESSARRVAEKAAEEISRLSALAEASPVSAADIRRIASILSNNGRRRGDDIADAMHHCAHILRRYAHVIEAHSKGQP